MKDPKNIFKTKHLDDPEGKIVGRDDNKAVITNAEDIIIFGSSGTGKTSNLIYPNILSSISAGESLIITDPKGELYKKTAHAAEKNGYKVHVLDFCDCKNSDKWNPLDILREEEDEAQRFYLTHDMAIYAIKNSFTDSKSDVFFDQSEENLLKALISYVGGSDQYHGERNFAAVYDLLQDMALNDGKCEALSKLPDDDPATPSWKMFQGSGRLKLNFITGLALRLHILQSKIISNILSSDENGIHLNDTDQKKAIYIIYPVTTDVARPFISMFIAQALHVYSNAETKVHFILDELSSIGHMHSITNYFNNENISITMAVQDMYHLKAFYRDVSMLIHNCALINTGVPDKETALLFSENIEDIARIATERGKIFFKGAGEYGEYEPYDCREHKLYE